jgi:subtilisin family serine protease
VIKFPFRELTPYNALSYEVLGFALYLCFAQMQGKIKLKVVQQIMKKFTFYISLMLVVFFSCPILAGTIETTPQYVEGEVLIVMEAPSASDYEVMGAFDAVLYSRALSNQTDGFARSRGFEADRTFPEIARFSGKNIVKLSSEYKSTAQLIRELSSDPQVESVQPNYIRRANRIPNDPYYPDDAIWPGFWGQIGMRQINMPQVWDYVTGSSSIAVAVFDTGIDYTHPDLNANMAIDSYGNYGRHFYNKGSVSSNAMDIDNHGTHVAGIIGAVGNNSIGVTGVNWDVKMLNVNVFTAGVVSGDPGAYDDDIINGINYVLSEKNKGLNIRAANMSLGGLSNPLPNNSPLGAAIKLLSDQGIICVMAAGNDGMNLNYSMQKIYPACFRFDNTIAVGNAHDGIYHLGSNFGDNWVDIGAPGGAILSTIKSNDLSPTFFFVGLRGYDQMTGTSMSAPHVTGAAAILCAAYTNESASHIKTRILNGANKNNMLINPGYWAHGYLDVWNAYRLPIITTTSLTGGAVSTIYSQALNVNSPGISGSITWLINSGSLPAGLSLNSSTGVITGTPTTAGTYNFTVQAQNSEGSDTKSLSIVITSGYVSVTSVELLIPDNSYLGKMLPYLVDVIIQPQNATNKGFSFKLYYIDFGYLDVTEWLQIVDQGEDYVEIMFEATGNFLLTVITDDGPSESYEVFVGNKKK